MLMISQKCQYAVRAVFELAKRRGDGPIKIEDLARAQAIPRRFLANILNQLRSAGVVDSTRGKKGGYVMARTPEQVTVGEVIRCIEGSLSPLDCTAAGGRQACPLAANCIFVSLWDKAQKATAEVYDSTSYRTLLREEERLQEKRRQGGFDYAI